MARPFNATPLTTEQSDLAARHVRVARSRANLFARQYPSLADEIESAAFEGLVLGARAYDHARGKPGNFLWLVIDRVILDTIEAELSRARRLKRRSATSLKGQRPGKIRKRGKGSIRVNPNAEHITEADDRDEARVLIARLDSRQLEAIRLIANEGLSQAKAAARMGCSAMQVTRLMAKARAKLLCPNPRQGDLRSDQRVTVPVLPL
jgi:RNA polymerase sigma factor (sigma-70 family)